LTVPNVVIVGSNHAYAPVAIREQLAFAGDSLHHGLQVLHETVGEGLILSTCNRTEIYAVDPGNGTGRERIFDFLVGYHHVPRSVLEHASYVHEGKDAVRHLFRVASGLDSLVLGEPQILSQIRDALHSAREAGSLGPVLQRLFTDALRTGKRARTETDIARNRVSIAHAAVDLAAHELGDLSRTSALVLGAGKMASLTGKLLRAQGVGDLAIINRSLPRAQELADAVNGHAIPMSGLSQAIAGADLVIGAVAVDTPMVTPAAIRSRRTPLLLIDISVPRSIAADVELVPLSRVRDVDALEPLASETRRQYADEVVKVEAVVEFALEGFTEWCFSRRGAAAIARLHQHGNAIRDREVQRTLDKLAHLSEHDQNLVRALAHAVSQKFMHAPTLALRRAETDSESHQVLEVLGVETGPESMG